MTVAELIAELQRLEPSMNVAIRVDGDQMYEIAGNVYAQKMAIDNVGRVYDYMPATAEPFAVVDSIAAIQWGRLPDSELRRLYDLQLVADGIWREQDRPKLVKPKPKPKRAPKKASYKLVNWLSYEDAKAVVRAAKIKGSREFAEWMDRPDNIPAAPAIAYKGDWIDWYDFLGKTR